MLEKLKIKLFKRSMEDYEINIDELKRKQRNGAVIVDVRSSQEFKEGHINGAINIPYYEINKNVTNLLKDKNQEIVLYCEAGVRSKQAYKKLKRFLYTNVFSLFKGIENWL